MEDGVGDRVVAVFEECEVDEAGAVFEGDEDDALAGGDGRRLGGGADSGDQDLLPGVHGFEVGGVGGADLAQQPVVVGHQVLRHVDGEHADLGVQGFAAGHLRQSGRLGGHELAAERELAVGGPGPGVRVELGGLQEQVAAGERAAQCVERADLDEPLADRQGGTGPLPEVLQSGVGLAGSDPGDLVFADALHRGQGESHPHVPLSVCSMR